jgi:predicted RNA-binding Zn-ribbon protein involved in translation (DUF1610 family)
MDTNNQPNWDAKEKGMMHMNYFRTLCEFYKGGQLLDDDINSKAKKMVKDVWETYRGEDKQEQSQSTQRDSGAKQKPTQCPECGKMTLYNNKGISSKSGTPYENVKCSNKDCGYLKWKTMNYDQHRLKEIERRQLDEVEESYPQY